MQRNHVLVLLQNTKGSDHFVGDIHGNSEMLLAVINTLNTDDRLFIVGDLTDRGPDSAGVLNIIIEHNNRFQVIHHRQQIYVTFGNHESIYLMFIAHIQSGKNIRTIAKYLLDNGFDWMIEQKGNFLNPRYQIKEKYKKSEPSWTAFIESLPYFILIEGEHPMGMVHADMPVDILELRKRINFNGVLLPQNGEGKCYGNIFTDYESLYLYWARLNDYDIPIQEPKENEHFDLPIICGHQVYGRVPNTNYWLPVRRDKLHFNLDVRAYSENHLLDMVITGGRINLQIIGDRNELIIDYTQGMQDQIQSLTQEKEDEYQQRFSNASSEYKEWLQLPQERSFFQVMDKIQQLKLNTIELEKQLEQIQKNIIALQETRNGKIEWLLKKIHDYRHDGNVFDLQEYPLEGEVKNELAILNDYLDEKEKAICAEKLKTIYENYHQQYGNDKKEFETLLENRRQNELQIEKDLEASKKSLQKLEIHYQPESPSVKADEIKQQIKKHNDFLAEFEKNTPAVETEIVLLTTKIKTTLATTELLKTIYKIDDVVKKHNASIRAAKLALKNCIVESWKDKIKLVHTENQKKFPVIVAASSNVLNCFDTPALLTDHYIELTKKITYQRANLQNFTAALFGVHMAYFSKKAKMIQAPKKLALVEKFQEDMSVIYQDMVNNQFNEDPHARINTTIKNFQASVKKFHVENSNRFSQYLYKKGIFTPTLNQITDQIQMKYLSLKS